MSSERVPISPIAQGMWIAYRVSCAFWSGRPNRVKGAGAGSVFHIASIAAIFIFWFCDTS